MSGTGTKTRILLYEAYGYTGRLTAELAAGKKLDVVLAGRNKETLTELGDRLGLSTRVVGLDDPGQLSQALKDIACVVHMAGPFATTSAPMLSACLAAQTSYIAITGEIEVLEDRSPRWIDFGSARGARLAQQGQSVLPALILVPVTIAAMVLQRANPVLTAGMLLLSLGFLYFAVQLSLIRSSHSASRLLFVSVIYLPLVFALQVLSRV